MEVHREFRNWCPPFKPGDLSLIRELTEDAELAPEELEELIAQHQLFLSSGGSDGFFAQRFLVSEASPLPINVYSLKSAKGGQMKIVIRKIRPGTSLSKFDLRFADLSGSDCSEVDFTEAQLDGANMGMAIYQGAKFTKARLMNADFTNADLRGADFRGALLQNVAFTGADCEGADFTGAHIKSADFAHANLKNVKR